MMKRMVSLILSFVLCLSLCVVSFAAEPEENGAETLETMESEETEDEIETGNLTVNYVTVNDNNDDYEVTVAISKNLAVNDRYESGFEGTYVTEDGESVAFEEGHAYVSMKSGESLTICNLPAGVYYLYPKTYGYEITSTPDYVIVTSGETTEYTLECEDITYSIPVSVVWNDENNATRPEGIDINLSAYLLGDEFDSIDLSATLSADNNWQCEFEDIYVCYDSLSVDGSSFYYDNRWQYEYEVTGDINTGFVITCTQILDTATSVKVVWEDNDDQDEIRPWYVECTLLMNGEVIDTFTPHEAYYYIDDNGDKVLLTDDWQENLSGFDLYSPEVTEKNYSIQAQEVEGYTCAITGNFEEGYTVTYTLASDGDSTSDDSDNFTDSLVVRRGNTYYFSYSLKSGIADKTISYGKATDEVLFGDWDGDGVDTICVRRGNAYYFSNSLKSGTADTVVYYGKATDEVLVGDWDGDGKDTLAVRRGNAYYISNTIKSGTADKTVYYGKATDTVLVGDWDGSGKDSLAVRRGNTYYISYTIKSGEADKVVAYGKATDEVLVGDWNGNGVDTLTVRRGNAYYISNTIKSGTADQTIYYGRSTDEVYAGKWN